VLGRWSFPSELHEGEAPQTQPPVETKEKEYKRHLTRRGSSNVLAHFSSIRVFTVLPSVSAFLTSPQNRHCPTTSLILNYFGFAVAYSKDGANIHYSLATAAPSPPRLRPPPLQTHTPIIWITRFTTRRSSHCYSSSSPIGQGTSQGRCHIC